MTTIAPRANEAGFSLVEVTLALGVAGFCLVAIFGLLPIGLASNRASVEQTAAASNVAALIADLRATQKTGSAVESPYFRILIPTNGSSRQTIFLKEDGSPSGSVNADADPAQNPRYRATLFFSAPSSVSHLSATTVRTLLTWPALADRSAGSLPSNFTGSFESITALDRH